MTFLGNFSSAATVEADEMFEHADVDWAGGRLGALVVLWVGSSALEFPSVSFVAVA